MLTKDKCIKILNAHGFIYYVTYDNISEKHEIYIKTTDEFICRCIVFDRLGTFLRCYNLHTVYENIPENVFLGLSTGQYIDIYEKKGYRLAVANREQCKEKTLLFEPEYDRENTPDFENMDYILCPWKGDPYYDEYCKYEARFNNEETDYMSDLHYL